MSDHWMPPLMLKLARADFDALPRHPAYKYELFEGTTYISPQPHYGHATLRLRRFRVGPSELGRARLRRVEPSDCGALAPTFCSAFARQQPFASLTNDAAMIAAENSLRFTFAGNDGPLAEDASFVALHEDKMVGAILITLLPGGEECDWRTMHWSDPPPIDLWQKGEGQPHLTWIFVQHFEQGEGVGTLLLQSAVRALKRQGYATLWTTFLIGNDSSLRWHWRNGFELAPHGLSKRRMRMKWT